MKVICFGEIMLRLSPPNNLRVAQARSLDVQYGGSEANVAVALAQFGASSAYVTRVPDTEVGRDRKSTRLNSSHSRRSRMPSSA